RSGGLARARRSAPGPRSAGDRDGLSFRARCLRVERLPHLRRFPFRSSLESAIASFVVEGLMERWTRVVLRFRWPILTGWFVVLLAGGFAFTHLSSLLSNEFSVPGTDSERARTILERHFGDRSDGAFTVVFRLREGVDRAAYVRLQRDVDRAARVVPDSTPRQLVPAGRNIVYGDIVSTLSIAKAKGYTDDLYRALPHGGGVQSYVTGQAAIQHDLDPIFSKDLRKGEMIALPIAVLVLLAVFGLSVAVTMPFIFAACTVMATLAGVYVYAHFLTTATYVTNLVFLIGLGIAID